MALPKLYSPTETQKMLGINRNKLLAVVKAGKLRRLNMGVRKYAYAHEDVERYIKVLRREAEKCNQAT